MMRIASKSLMEFEANGGCIEPELLLFWPNFSIVMYSLHAYCCFLHAYCCIFLYYGVWSFSKLLQASSATQPSPISSQDNLFFHVSSIEWKKSCISCHISTISSTPTTL